MIVSHEFKTVFITTPKSGSHTGFKLMEKYLQGKARRFNHIIPGKDDYPGYFRFTFVRNPYERFCSLYHACVVNDNKSWVPKKARKNILNYAKWYANLTKNKSWIRKDLTASQSEWHKYSTIHKYIQIENAQKEIDELFFPTKIIIPHELKRKHSTWEEVRTEELTKLINYWAGQDFSLYGYERENSNS